MYSEPRERVWWLQMWSFLNAVYVPVQSLIKFYVIIFFILFRGSNVFTPKTPRQLLSCLSITLNSIARC